MTGEQIRIEHSENRDRVAVTIGGHQAHYRPRRAFGIALEALDTAADNGPDDWVTISLVGLPPFTTPAHIATELAKAIAVAADQIIDDTEISI